MSFISLSKIVSKYDMIITFANDTKLGGIVKTKEIGNLI